MSNHRRYGCDPSIRRAKKLAYMNEYAKTYYKSPIGIKKYTDMTYKMIAKYPEKYKARYQLRNAVKLGKVIKPEFCDIPDCESKARDAHHEDYSKPLEVMWFCLLHHKEIHYAER